MRILKCKCGTEFTARSSGHKFCDNCADKERKLYQKEYKKKHRKGIYSLRKCIVCGKEHEVYFSKKYCDKCLKDKEKKRYESRILSGEFRNYAKKRYAENPKKFLDRAKKRNADVNHKIKINIYRRAWYLFNKDKVREIKMRRRAQKLTTQTSKLNINEIYSNSPFCFYCNKPLTLKEATFDHFIPLSKGGLHAKENMRISCKHCNCVKNNKIPTNLFFMEV